MKGSLFCSVWKRAEIPPGWQTPWWWPGLGTERSPLSVSGADMGRWPDPATMCL